MFGALLRLCGLNAGDASYFLGVHRRVILGWLNGAEEPPAEVHEQLYNLFHRQEEAAEEIIGFWRESGEPDVFELRIPTTNEASQKAGWPCITAQVQPIAMAQATLANVTITLKPEA